MRRETVKVTTKSMNRLVPLLDVKVNTDGRRYAERVDIPPDEVPRDAVILLQLQGPMMSFGGVQVNQRFVTDMLPSRSMIVGMIGAALGIRRHEGHKLNALASRVSYACRTQMDSRIMEDYHVADLGLPHMLSENAWSTSGVRHDRTGSVKEDKVIQRKEYVVDSSVFVALRIEPNAGIAPGILTHEAKEWARSVNPELIVGALQRPIFPLYIGRKTCVPSRPVLEAVTTAEMMDAVGLLPESGYTLRGDDVPRYAIPGGRTKAMQRLKVVTASGLSVEEARMSDRVAGIREGTEHERDFARQVGVSVLASASGTLSCHTVIVR